MTALAHLGDFHTEVIGYGLACVAIVGLVVYDWLRRRRSAQEDGSAEAGRRRRATRDST